MDLAVELQKIYDSEINVRIGWLWDGGIEVRLGDEVNVRLVDDLGIWLQEACVFLSDLVLRRFSKLRSQEACRQSPIPAPENRRGCKLPTLRRVSCGITRHG